jgi:hypothetical protein
MGHVARKGDGGGAHRFLVGRPERERERERDHLEYLGVNVRIILKLILIVPFSNMGRRAGIHTGNVR